MSYALIISEVRRGVFEERNLDAIGIANLAGKDTYLLIPEGNYNINNNLVDKIIRVKTEESLFLNPLIVTELIVKMIGSSGLPDIVVFTHSSSGIEMAGYLAGKMDLPMITDVSNFKKDEDIFFKSYYSDKVFGQFKKTKDSPLIITVRSGSFKDFATDKGKQAEETTIEGLSGIEERTFIEYVEEEKAGV
ncbi:MAG TPA: hypothetical protein PLW88_07350, partial [Syntrophorhabdaceae bacterium]|nr:hypothetical protein [Syntrophorhabdaceae bacterium]